MQREEVTERHHVDLSARRAAHAAAVRGGERQTREDVLAGALIGGPARRRGTAAFAAAAEPLRCSTDEVDRITSAMVAVARALG